VIVHNLAGLAKLTKFPLMSPKSGVRGKGADSNYFAVSDNLLLAAARDICRVKDEPKFRFQHIGCADDPPPGNEINEYCEVLLDIDKCSAETRVELVTETAR
jgi:hypothetical protein